MADYRRTMTLIVVVDHIAGEHDSDDWDDVSTEVENAIHGIPVVWRGETEYQVVHVSVETIEPNDDEESTGD